MPKRKVKVGDKVQFYWKLYKIISNGEVVGISSKASIIYTIKIRYSGSIVKVKDRDINEVYGRYYVDEKLISERTKKRTSDAKKDNSSKD